MQIIIPMTGSGARFKAAGYQELKPLIKIHNKPIIEWVVKMFSQDDEVIFICRGEHLEQISNFKSELKRIRPNAQIFAIDNWLKKGPVFDIIQAKTIIKDDQPAIINYCDFYMNWDYEDFKKTVHEKNCDGAIPCYTGFHPHLIPAKNLYASCKVDENQNLIEIKEKFSWQEDKSKAFHSAGTYYFKSGALLKKYCQKQIEQDISLNGEYYASLTYNLLCEDGLITYIYDRIEHFCQWGTPEDLEEYLFWINNIKNWA